MGLKSKLQKQFEEETGMAAWINADIYPDGVIQTREYTRWLEKKVGVGDCNKPDVIKSVCSYEGNKDDECWKVLGRCIVCEHYKQTVL